MTTTGYLSREWTDGWMGGWGGSQQVLDAGLVWGQLAWLVSAGMPRPRTHKDPKATTCGPSPFGNDSWVQRT